jgi:hypothetical protein
MVAQELIFNGSEYIATRDRRNTRSRSITAQKSAANYVWQSSPETQADEAGP